MGGRFPALRPSEESGRIFFRGPFDVTDEGAVLDTYALEVELPPNYQEALPLVREVGGRIPRVSARHVNKGDGTLCVCIPAAYLVGGGSPWLPDYLAGPVRSYLIGNSIVERGGQWPWGEWRHGVEGLLDFLGPLLGTTDRATLMRYLDLLAKPRLKGHWECPCGSGMRLRDCHMKPLLVLGARLPRKSAESTLEQLAKGPVKGAEPER